jgi:hypothetical protein
MHNPEPDNADVYFNELKSSKILKRKLTLGYR